MLQASLSLGLVCFWVIMSVSGLLAQGTRADYERAERLGEITRDKVLNERVEFRWLGDGARGWYRRQTVDGWEIVLVDAARAEKRLAFDHARLAAGLTNAAGKSIDARRLPIERLDPVQDGSVILIEAYGKGWKCDLDSYEITEHEKPKAGQKGRRMDGRGRRGGRGRSSRGDRSPDKRWQTFTKDRSLWLRDLESKEEHLLAEVGEGHHYDANVYWSPDSKKIVALRTKKASDHTVYLIESAPKDRTQPKLHSHNYHKPGDELDVTSPRLFDVETKKEVSVGDDLFSNPWSIRGLRWDRDGSRFTFVYNQRGHQVLRIVAVDATSGEASALVNEESETFVDYSHKQYSRFIDDTGEIIWMSERDGWNHLYLFDAKTGALKNPITNGEWVVRRVLRVDDEKREIWFQASGIYPDQDPYYVHFCRVGFDGGSLVVLTEGDGTHSIELSPAGEYFVDRFSRVDMPPVTEIRRTMDGKLVCGLEKADMSALLETGWKTPERFVAKGRDGRTDIYGVILRPTSFDPSRKYPIIEKIYAGPHGSFVPKSFGRHFSAQSIAELGFIVVQIDGMGTSNRSKAFHDVCWKNLGDSGFPDRKLWIRAAAKRYPYMDVSRVGIYGGSAGGQSALRALLAHPEFYHVGVADCGCHDNRMDKVWWNELWMGWPIGDHYAEQSNVTNARKLEGKLLLTVGELDRNVDPASTMQVVDALIKADKDFDLVVFPGAGHGIGESRYGKRRRRDFFVRHLLKVEPRWEP